MNGGQTVTIPKGISHYPHGIVLVWSGYDNDTIRNYYYHEDFVHKGFVARNPGGGSCFSLTTSKHGASAVKYLYISDRMITGHDQNVMTGTGYDGVLYTNNLFVLREVWGV